MFSLVRTARLNSIRESTLRRKNCEYNVELRPVALARIQGQSWKRDKTNTLNIWYFILPLSQQNTSKKYLAMTQFVSIIVSKCCITRVMKSKGGAVVRALASTTGGPGSNPGVDAICGLSLLLVLSFTPRDFSTVIPVLPSP